MSTVRDREQLARQVAETYADDSWKRVKQYRRVQQYCTTHPDQGSAAVASALNLSRSRVRTWVDNDGMPDPMRGILACEGHGWLDLNYGDPPFSGLNILLAWIFSGGSISSGFAPRFAIDGASDRHRITAAFERVGIDYRIERAHNANRGTEVVPVADVSLFGRALVALGAPQGAKHSDSDLSLPSFLSTAPQATRQAFAGTYVLNRGVENKSRANFPLQIVEQRPSAFRRELLALFRELVDEPNHVRGTPDAQAIRFTPTGAAELSKLPGNEFSEAD